MAVEKDQAFVEMVVKAVVDYPDDVKVERTLDERGVFLKLSINPEDMGKIIGKEGRTAKAIRTLLRIVGAKENARVNLKIMEPEGSQRPMRDEEQPESAAEPVEETSEPTAEEKPEKATSDKDDDKEIEAQPIEEEKATEII